MLKKIYCHTKPDKCPSQWVIKSTYCEVGKWYYYHEYKTGPMNSFDIKLFDDRMSKTMLCMRMSEMSLFFWTREEYRDIMIDDILSISHKLV